MVRDFKAVQSISIGENFTFGYKRSGNVPLLERLGAELGFAVHALPAVEWRGQPVSSTRIREAVQAGELDAAGEMLGRHYSLRGAVLRGDQLGRQLGFPTANLDIAGLALPPCGVYAGWAHIAHGRLPAVMNIGYRPTLNQPKPALRVEVHLLDFGGDLYGKELEFEVIKSVRTEQKFGSLDALKEQIARDVAQARQWLGLGTP
jgi:riboflavin kinase/FMN adenylyltransferase